VSATKRCVVAALVVFASACTSSEGEQATTPTTAPSDQYAAVTQVLQIDLGQLPNYASPTWPAHYDALVRGQDNATANNPVTDRGATLGRVLFHDRKLSISGTVSCASCHKQGEGFTDSAKLSVGFSGGTTATHSMRLANARFYAPGTAFWDRRALSLEAQATEPIKNAVEMGFDSAHGGIDSLLDRMRTLPYYPVLFAFTFGDSSITEARIQRALAQYVRSLVSLNARFDQGFAAVFNAQLPDRGVTTPFANYTAQENRGKQLFFLPPPQGGAGCGGCHTAPTLALVGNSLSNGLDAGETTIFKSPSLKNVAAAGSYMHDGRFATLAQVVQHYVRGVQDGPALDQRLRGPNGGPQRLQLSAADQAALVAFLQTLTDSVLATVARFGDPFRK